MASMFYYTFLIEACQRSSVQVLELGSVRKHGSMQEGFKYYVNNVQFDVLRKKHIENTLPPPLKYPCNLTKIMHLGTKKTIL